MSRDELSVMDGSKCILQLRGVRPFLSDKFDITKHKRYKELSDFDKKNAFDVERYLKHELRLRMDEEFDCYACIAQDVTLSSETYAGSCLNGCSGGVAEIQARRKFPDTLLIL